jgi:hypothetical protein
MEKSKINPTLKELLIPIYGAINYRSRNRDYMASSTRALLTYNALTAYGVIVAGLAILKGIEALVN